MLCLIFLFLPLWIRQIRSAHEQWAVRPGHPELSEAPPASGSFLLCNSYGTHTHTHTHSHTTHTHTHTHTHTISHNTHGTHTNTHIHTHTLALSLLHTLT